ncbi:MAG: GIY-YIG nuclease family protein [Chitinophagaceae bacterium]|nr:GIY-YIG nuclease family protein [Chitinophagaceae bacterium]
MSLFYFYQKHQSLNFTVYILYSVKHNEIYIGFTSHLINRFKSHNELGDGWTAKFRPWKIIYCKYFNEKKEPMVREKYLKQYRQRLNIREKITRQFFELGFIDLLKT